MIKTFEQPIPFDFKAMAKTLNKLPTPDIKKICIYDIAENPIHSEIYNRFSVDNEVDQSLIYSIKKHNHVVIIVRKSIKSIDNFSDKSYILLSGYRRLCAIKEINKQGASISSVYAYILKYNEDNLTHQDVCEKDFLNILRFNIQHNDTEIETFRKYQLLSSKYDYCKKQNEFDEIKIDNKMDKYKYIALNIGISRAQAAKYGYLLNNGSEELINDFKNGKITLNKACNTIKQLRKK